MLPFTRDKSMKEILVYNSKIKKEHASIVNNKENYTKFKLPYFGSALSLDILISKPSTLT